jgi:small subunit ribosomal protein S20
MLDFPWEHTVCNNYFISLSRSIPKVDTLSQLCSNESVIHGICGGEILANSTKRRLSNMAHKTEMRTSIKKTLKAIASADIPLATELFRTTTSILHKLANKGVVHKNKAARLVARISSRLKEKQAS